MTIKRITAADFAEIHSSKPHTTIDLRTASEYQNECLEGCLALPVQELDKGSLDHLLNVAKYRSGPIYLLCQSGKRAEIAVEKLQGSVHELVIIEGGLNAVKETGKSIKKGASNIISLERQVRIAAGTLVLIGAILAVTFNPLFIGLSAFVGAGLMFAGITNTCGMAMIIARMPWNNIKKEQV